ncbi:MAG: deoxyribonuclease IV [Novosphingobium sp.]|nr:deoxyribonuclease IV [Novosphingobium sp.]
MKIESKLGAHMSIQSGIEKALYRGSVIGCNTIQIFIRSNRRWEFQDFTDIEIEKFQQAKKETNIYSVIAHARYLINLASLSHETKEKSIQTLERELINCDKLGMKYLVLHPGSGSDNKQQAIDQVANSINYIFAKNNSLSSIAIENTAGQGNYLGAKFEEISSLISKIENKSRISVCLDTCHAWAAGYNFSTQESYKQFMKDFDSILGIENLKVMHLNNSKNKLNSHIDRHEDIDKGQIDIEAFKLIINDKRFYSIDKILETPHNTDEDFKRNLLILKNLMQ